MKAKHVQYNTIIRCVMPCLLQCTTQAPKKLKPKAFDVDPDQLESDHDDDDKSDGEDNNQGLGMTGVETPRKKCQSEGTDTLEVHILCVCLHNDYFRTYYYLCLTPLPQL